MEKGFAWDLFHKGIPYFLPMVERCADFWGPQTPDAAADFHLIRILPGRPAAPHCRAGNRSLVPVVNVPDQKQLLHELMAIRR